MPGLLAVLGGNAVGIDPNEAEREQREKYPLLLHPEEHIEMAFQVKGFGRDKSFLTTHRILIKDGKGVGNKRRSYLSIPYNTIQAFAVETAGSILDDDTELKLWTNGKVTIKIEFSKREINVWSIQQYMNAKMDWRSHNLETVQDWTPAAVDALAAENHPIPADQWKTPLKSSNNSSSSKKISVFDWLGGNAHTMDPKQAEDQLKTITPVLLADETVHMAFRERRDSIFFTSHRLLVVDVQGLTGKKIAFESFPWRCIRGFEIQTAGAYFDVDSELILYTNIRGYGRIQQDFRQAQVDLHAIQQYISNRILGMDKMTTIQRGVDRKEGHVDPKGNWWFRDNQRPLDAVEIDRYYHETIQLLQEGEHVEFAFKGRRDVTLFTTKRIIDIDPKGLKGVKICYTSIPWKSILAFGACTQGKYLDSDSELLFWTDMMYFNPPGDDPPEPGMSFFDFDFNPKLVDVLRLKQYISKRILLERNQDADDNPIIPIDPNMYVLAPTDDGTENWMDFFGDNQRAIDPRGVEEKLRNMGGGGDLGILLEDERVVMAFQAGRDIVIFTNLRVMDYDIRGLSGKKLKLTSIPYSSIRAFKVESAGMWDRDAELDLYTRNLWDMGKISMDFRNGKADIIALQRFLAAIVLGTPQDATRYLSQAQSFVPRANPAGMSHFLSWLTDNAKEEDASMANTQLHADPPILLSNETVEKSFRQGRDLYLYTTHRILVVDVQGLRGKRVEYKSYPWHWCKTFEIETAGHLDRDAEVYVDLDVARGKQIDQSILVKMHDIYTLHEYLTRRLLFTPQAPTVQEEPEFVLY